MTTSDLYAMSLSYDEWPSKKQRTAVGYVQNSNGGGSSRSDFALKLLMKMGYKPGGGLGKNEQGITTLIEVKRRPKGMGLGYNEYQVTAPPVLTRLPVLAPLPVPVVKETVDISKRENTMELDFRDAEKDKKRTKKMQPFVSKKRKEDKKFEASTLVGSGFTSCLHKMGFPLSPMVEKVKEVESATKELLSLPPQIVRIIRGMAGIDVKRISMYLSKENERVERFKIIKNIAYILEKAKRERSLGILTLDSIVAIFGDLKREFEKEYEMFSLGGIARSLAYPLLGRFFKGWEPHRSPSHGTKMMALWMDLLLGDDSHYDHIVDEVVLPEVIAGTISWRASDSESMLRFLELWDDLLPPQVVQSILEIVVMPKLSAEVELWEPEKHETNHIHQWVHPWMPLLGQRLETLYPMI